MAESHIRPSVANELALNAADHEAERQLAPTQWTLWSSSVCPARYEMAPQADEWESILGFIPDHKTYTEIGYLLPDESGRSSRVCRVLVDRRVPGSVVRIEWYPTRLDPRKRPD